LGFVAGLFMAVYQLRRSSSTVDWVTEIIPTPGCV